MGTAISCTAQSGNWPYSVSRYTNVHTHSYPSLPLSPYTHHTHTPGFSLGSDPSGIQSVQREVRTRVVSSGSSFISCLPYFFILASTCVCVGGGRCVCVGVDEGGREGVHVNVFNICVHFVFKASSFCLALTSSNERCLRYSKASTQLFLSSS